MKRWLQLQSDPIDEMALAQSRERSASSGAVVQFLGVVRGHENSGAISAIDYEAFEAMARHQFEKIFDEVQSRWPVESIRLVHRTGLVRAGEPSLWVEILAPHRGEAFAACQHLIEEMKKRVPIWKKPVS